jgi:RIO kinase 1
MRTPEALETLVDYGIVEEVLRPLMSGKEANVYLVRSGGELRVAKVYKEAEQRSFKQRSDYTEGRSTRNSRDRRAMAKHSEHGRKQDEAAWRSAEVNAIYKLSAAGVRVPVPYHFVEGVLVMELVRDHEGFPASRLGDLEYAPAVARQIFDILLGSVVRMLCAGVVHGDLSEFNVLMAADGPVVIDFPQAVDPATNLSARKLLIRDVDNLLRFLGRHVREARPLPYAQEMWELYQQNLLTPDTQLRGHFRTSHRPTNTADVLSLIGDAEREQRRRTGAPPPQRGPRGPKVETIVKPRSAGPRPPQTPQDGPRRPNEPRPAPRQDNGPRANDPRPPRQDNGPRANDPRPPRQDNGPRGNDPRGPAARPRDTAPRPQSEPASPRPGESAQPSGRQRRRRSRGGPPGEPDGGGRSPDQAARRRQD